MSRESSITVAVRIRPFTELESSMLIVPRNGDNHQTNSVFTNHNTNRLLQQQGIRKILNAVDDRMLIFDPPDTNPLVAMEQNAFPNGFSNGNNHGDTRKSRIGEHSSRIREHRFVFDRLFDEDATQQDVFENTTKPLLDSVLDGFNATIFAYGATGCGKTHTITGTPDSPGIIFLAIQELFGKIEELKDKYSVELSLSYLEIYNETIRDLLHPSNDSRRLVLREDINKRISVTNLSTRVPNSVEEVMDMIVIGNQNRTVSPTEANSTSSRSHAVLQIDVIKRPRTSDLNEEHNFATLSIIDLAGSERASATRNKGARLHEGANINKSLLALGNCINALCDPRKRNHVPYRDSKLTRLLKFSLGGNCKTFMIVCVSPSSRHYDETLNTLNYADRAKEIKTKLIRNQQNLSRHVGSYLKMITEQKREIEELRDRERKVIDAEIQKFTRKREICQEKLLSEVNELEKSVNKCHQTKIQKAYVLAKRKLLLLQKFQVEELLNSLDNRFGTDHDFTEIDLFIPGFGQVLHLSETLLTKLIVQISELESQYGMPTELDFIIKDSSKQILKKLTELEGWTENDTIMFDNCVIHLKESIERSILFESSIMFDQSIKQLKSFSFVYENLFRSVAIMLDISSENQEALNNIANSLKEIVRSCVESLNYILDNGLNLIVNSTMIPRPDSSSMLSDSANATPPSSSSSSVDRSAMSGILAAGEDILAPLSPFEPMVIDLQRQPSSTLNNRKFRSGSDSAGGKRLSSSPLAKSAVKKLNRLTTGNTLTRSISDSSAFSLNNNKGISLLNNNKTNTKKVRWDVPSVDESDVSMNDGVGSSRKCLSSPLRDSVPPIQKVNNDDQYNDDNDESVSDADSFKASEFKFDFKKFNLLSPSSSSTITATTTTKSGDLTIGSNNRLTSKSLIAKPIHKLTSKPLPSPLTTITTNNNNNNTERQKLQPSFKLPLQTPTSLPQQELKSIRRSSPILGLSTNNPLAMTTVTGHDFVDGVLGSGPATVLNKSAERITTEEGEVSAMDVDDGERFMI